MILNRSRKRPRNLSLADRIVAGLCTLLMRPSRLVRSAIVLRPSTLLRLHRTLIGRKYRRLFSARVPMKPGPKGPSQEVIAAVRLEFVVGAASKSCEIADLWKSRHGCSNRTRAVKLHLAGTPVVGCNGLLELKALLRAAMQAGAAVLEPQHPSLITIGGADATGCEPSATLATDPVSS